MGGYRQVLVGTDGSVTAAAAVRHAAKLARACGARLTVVTAYTPNPVATARARREAPEEILWRITDSAAAEAHAAEGKRLALEAGAPEVQAIVQDGDPAEALVHAAEDVGADVIVVGSKGMTSAARFLLGSVPNKVSHHAPCDVLIVHTA